MTLTKKQVEHTAKLARLGIAEKEKKKFSKELSAILEFVEKLNKVKTDKIKPTAHIIGLENVVREDKGSLKSKQETKGLIGLVPETKDGYVKVKTIL